MGRCTVILATLALLAILVGSEVLGAHPALTPPRALAADDCQTFAQTGKRVCGEFLAYWNAHGGLAQQGYPVSDLFSEQSDTDGNTYGVQYFERAVFELHPALPPGQRVLLSLLGAQKYTARYGGMPPGTTPMAMAVAATASPTGTGAASVSLTPMAAATPSPPPMATATGPLPASAIAAGLAVPPTFPVVPAVPVAPTTAAGALPGPAMGVDVLQGGCANGYRTVVCGFLLRNTTAMTFGVVALAYTLYDSGGAVVATDTANAYYVHGGERVGATSSRARPDNVVPARVEVQVVSVTPLDGKPDYAALTSGMAGYLANDGNPQVSARIGNTNGAITGRVEVSVILFDEAGTIVGAGSGIVNDLPDHGQRSVEVTVTVTGGSPARIEVFAAPYFFGL